MAQVSTFKIEGQPRRPFKQAKTIELEAIFATENNPDLTLDAVTFSNTNGSNDRDTLYTYWQSKPLEGVDVNIQIEDNVNGTPYSFDFDFFTDWSQLSLLADNELEVALRKFDSSPTFDKRALAITFALLEDKGFLSFADYFPIPYIIENRKTLLEKIQLLAQLFMTIKMFADEVHKLINIASDLTSAGIIQATLNLTTTIANLVLMINQFKQLLTEIVEAFFPPVLYHAGVQPKTFIEKGCEYLGYDGVEFGNHVPNGATRGFGEIMNRLAWCPSKNDEIGFPFATSVPSSGAMKPNNYGYNLNQAIEYFVEFYNCRKAIINNVVHIRPKSDPFWLQTAGAPAPDVLVEQSSVHSNGTKRPNYDEFFSSTIVEYITDDSDLHTLRDLAIENDTASSQKIISGVIVEPNSVTNQKRVVSEKGKYIEIPHSLCVRKDAIDDLLDAFLQLQGSSNSMVQQIKDQFNDLIDILAETFPVIQQFTTALDSRSGVMKIENHFFSTPKTVFLEDTNILLGNAPRIPADFADHIGAQALIEHFQNYNSFVPGVRNPSNPNDTNAKIYYDEVDIHMNLPKFTQILNTPYFNVGNGVEGKYESVKWNVEKDKAVATYWIQEPWMQNVEQKTIEAI